jgi:ATP-dependent Clp protease ATP-binding subunit ClpA
MFERFTDRARRVVVLAQEEARLLNHNYIGTEHILLGLVHEGQGVAAKAVESLGISLGAIRRQVEEIIGQGQSPPTGHIPFTPRAKKVLELSLREALQLGHNYIGTEHILLGLIREGDGVGAQVLEKLGADLDRAREAVITLLSGTEPVEERPSVARRRARGLVAMLRTRAEGRPLSEDAERVLELAEAIATWLGDDEIRSIDLLWALVRAGEREVLAALSEMGADVEAARRRIEDVMGRAAETAAEEAADEAADEGESGPEAQDQGEDTGV